VYIWEDKTWPYFSLDAKVIKPRLKNVLALQKQLTGKAKDLPTGLDKQAEMDALIQDAIKTSQIEGETLNVSSVRSSVAKHLGLDQAGLAPGNHQSENLIAMLCSATDNLDQPINQQILCEWQAALFPEPSITRNLAIGKLRGEAPMQVTSQVGNREIIHFEAPPKKRLQQELDEFIDWFNLVQPMNLAQPMNKNVEMHGIVRAAVTHLWLITIHPFEDGNGRVTRAITDRALAQDDKTSIRFYSLSAVIESNRTAYYEILENTQNCKTKMQQDGSATNITEWVNWFLEIVALAMQYGLQRIERVVDKTRFWQTHSQTVLSAQQIKVLNRLLDSAGDEFIDGISAKKYQGIANVSKATATRHLTELVTKACLIQLPGGGRSTRYAINTEFK